MGDAQDRAEACIRSTITVGGIVILPEWPEYARRIVAALEGVDRLSWGDLRAAFGEGYDGSYGADYVVRHLTDGGVIERVFWDVDTGEPVDGPDWHTLMERLHAAQHDERWKTWAEKTAFGYRLRAAKEGASE